MTDLNSGGRVAITLDNRIYHPVADVEVEDTDIEPDVVVNQDGTINRTVMPKPYRVNVTFRDRRGLDLNALIHSCGFDCTVVEKDRRRTVLMTQAFVVGTSSRNTQNGEISGLQIVSNHYKAIEAVT